MSDYPRRRIARLFLCSGGRPGRSGLPDQSGRDGRRYTEEPRLVHSLRPWLIGAVYGIVLMPLTVSPRHSGNVWSRYMTVESLVERGTLAIERSPLLPGSGSPDLIRVGPHLYSDKPPVLSVAAAVVYLPLERAGLRFTPRSFVVVNWVLVTAFAGLGSVLALVGLRQLLQTAAVAPWAADLWTLAFGFGSQLWTYAVTFNNHSVAAGLTTLALALVVRERPGQKTAGRRFLAGLLAGLAATVDVPAGGALVVVLGVWLAGRRRGVPGAFLAGCAGPLILHAVLQTLVTGTPLPAEMTPALLSYKGSYWASGPGRWVEHGPRWRFGLELLFGPQGWLTVTPVLMLGLAGLVWTAWRRDDPLRPAALAVGALVVTLLVFYTWGVRRTDFAGLSFGTRHLLAITPAVFWFAVVLLGRLPRWAWLVFAPLFLVGVVYAWAGMRDPWSRIERRDDSGLAVVKRLTVYPWSSYTR